MKNNFLGILFIVIVLASLNSCSSDSLEEENTLQVAKVEALYNYSTIEIEALDLINAYRVSNGLNALEKINYVSLKSEEHVNYMISNNVVNHNDFVARSQDIMKKVGAINVGENIAYNYNSSKAALEAWIKSPTHKINLDGDYTHFGISVRQNPIDGKKYYTNIFVKK